MLRKKNVFILYNVWLHPCLAGDTVGKKRRANQTLYEVEKFFFFRVSSKTFINLIYLHYRKLEDLSPSTHNMNVPNVTRMDYNLIDIDEDGFLSLMTAEGGTKEDVKLPEGELGEKLQEDFDEGKDLMVSVVSAMGEEHCLAYKEAPK